MKSFKAWLEWIEIDEIGCGPTTQIARLSVFPPYKFKKSNNEIFAWTKIG
jgi:hypothetical protein